MNLGRSRLRLMSFLLLAILTNSQLWFDRQELLIVVNIDILDDSRVKITPPSKSLSIVCQRYSCTVAYWQ
jgi:hypothetical protein